MKAQIKHVLKAAVSKYGNGHFFVIKVKTEDGIDYDIVPSSDCNTYSEWLIIAKDINSWYDGFQILMHRSDGKNFFNKKVLPIKINK